MSSKDDPNNSPLEQLQFHSTIEGYAHNSDSPPPTFDSVVMDHPPMHNFYIPSSDKGYFYKPGKILNKNGLGWFVTGLFLVGDLVGGGLVALPKALVQFGLIPGLFFLCLTSFFMTYTAMVLGRSWVIIQRRWPQHYIIEHCRKPYPEIAFRACGKCEKQFVSKILTINQFAVAVLYLLLPAKNISVFLKLFFDVNISFCMMIVILAVGLLPLTFMKSPKDFWAVVIASMITSTTAVILIIWGASIDYPSCVVEHRIPPFSLSNYFLGLGVFLFAYSGHAAIPTIQHDMLKPHHFERSAILGFTFALMGYLTYGDSIKATLIYSIQTTEIQQAVNLLITFHCVLTLTFKLNPINQDMEETLNIPQAFAFIGGMSATVSSLMQMADTEFLPPCYVSFFLNKNITQNLLEMHGTTYCCGFNNDISIYGNATQYCSKV